MREPGRRIESDPVGSEPISFDEIWRRICALEREFFQTHQKRWFTYRIEGDCLLPSHEELRVPRSDFELVVPMLPISDPRKIAKLVTGYPYVAAVINDPRVSRGDW